MGARRGSRVAFLSPNNCEFFPSVAGLQQAVARSYLNIDRIYMTYEGTRFFGEIEEAIGKRCILDSQAYVSYQVLQQNGG